jgi:hypothetical protein
MNIEVTTGLYDWWFRYEYDGMNIHVRIDKEECGPETALTRAAWVIHDMIEELDNPYPTTTK